MDNQLTHYNNLEYLIIKIYAKKLFYINDNNTSSSIVFICFICIFIFSFFLIFIIIKYIYKLRNRKINNSHRNYIRNNLNREAIRNKNSNKQPTENINLNRQSIRNNNSNRESIINSNLNKEQIRKNLNSNEIRNDININQENENKRKIELLFYKILYPMKYSLELFKNNTNNSTICLENYIDQKSLICLASYNHIFHYDCFKKGSLNK